MPRDIHETSRRWVEERCPTLAYHNKLPHGGHYPGWERPETFVTEVRQRFRSVR